MDTNKRSKENSRIEDWLNTIDTSLDESDNKDEIFSPRNTESFPKGSASDPIDPLLSDKPCDKEKISSD